MSFTYNLFFHGLQIKEKNTMIVKGIANLKTLSIFVITSFNKRIYEHVNHYVPEGKT